MYSSVTCPSIYHIQLHFLSPALLKQIVCLAFKAGLWFTVKCNFLYSSHSGIRGQGFIILSINIVSFVKLWVCTLGAPAIITDCKGVQRGSMGAGSSNTNSVIMEKVTSRTVSLDILFTSSQWIAWRMNIFMLILKSVFANLLGLQIHY